MGRFAIVAYRPKADKEQALLAAIDKHLRVLAAEGLVTDRPTAVMRAADGTVLEVFEWRSSEAIQQAHTNAAVAALWGEFSQVCDYRPLAELKESHDLFAEFEALDSPPPSG